METGTFLAVIGTLIGIIGVILAAVFYHKRDVVVTLGYRIERNRPLVADQHMSAFGGITVKIGGSETSEPWLVVLQIGHVGRGSIRPHDFDGPVYFEVNSSNILALQFSDLGTTEGAPLRLKPYHRDREDRILEVGIAPQVLNLGDALEISLLSDGRILLGRPKGRFAGRIVEVRGSLQPRSRRRT